MVNRLARALDIKPAEQHRVGLLLTHSFFIGIFVSTYFSFANGAFLNAFELQLLPLAYICSGVSGYLATLTFSKLQSKLPLSRLLVITLLFLLALVVIFKGGLFVLNDSKWLVFLVFIWAGPILSLIGLQFWSMVGNMFDLRQGKRLFGIIGSGDVISSIIGYISIPFILTRMDDTSHLLLIGIVGLLAGIFFQVQLIRRFGSQINLSQQEGSDKKTSRAAKQAQKRSLLDIFRNPYFTLVFSVMVISVVSSYLVDYGFMGAVRTRFEGQPKTITQVIGGFFGVIKIAELFGKTVLTGKLLNKFGMRFGLLVLPIILLVFALIAAFAGLPVLLGQEGATISILLLMPLAFNKLFDRFIRRSIEEPSFKVLYQPLEASARIWLQTQTEGTAKQLAVIIVGLLLAAGSLMPNFGLVHADVILCVLLVAWIAMSFRLSKEYRGKVLDQLKAFSGQKTTKTTSSDSIYRLTKGLKGKDFNQVMRALYLIDRTEPGAARPFYTHLVHSGIPEVQLAVLKLIERQHDLDQLDEVSMLAQEENSEAFQTVVERVRDKLIRWKNTPGAELVELAHSHDQSYRVMAAHLLRFATPELRAELVAPLLKDHEPEVVFAVLNSIPPTEAKHHFEFLINHLGHPVYSSVVSRLVGETGTEAIPHLGLAIKQHGDDSVVLLRIVRLLFRMGDEDATELLQDLRHHPSDQVRSVVLDKLRMLAHKANEQEVPFLKDQIRNEVGYCTWLLAGIQAFRHLNGYEQLVTRMVHSFQQSNGRVLDLLAFRYDNADIQQIRGNLESGVREREVLALEMADLVLEEDLKTVVLPLIDRLPIGEKFKNLNRLYPQAKLEPAARLESILNHDFALVSPWIKAEAMRILVREKPTVTHHLLANLFHRDHLLKEASYLTLFDLDPKQCFTYLNHEQEGFRKQLSPLIPEESKLPQLSIQERAQKLRQLGMFKDLPDNICLQLARNSRDMHLLKDTPHQAAFQKKDYLYTVLNGTVEVVYPNGVHEYFRPGELIGTLDNGDLKQCPFEVEEHVHILCIDAARFFEAVHVYPELATVLYHRVIALKAQPQVNHALLELES